MLATRRADVEHALVARAEAGTEELQAHPVGALERGTDRTIAIGHRRSGAQQHRAHRDANGRLAPGLEHRVEWSDDGSQLGGVRCRHGAMAPRPGEECAIGLDNGDAALDADGPRGCGPSQLPEGRLLR